MAVDQFQAWHHVLCVRQFCDAGRKALSIVLSGGETGKALLSPGSVFTTSCVWIILNLGMLLHLCKSAATKFWKEFTGAITCSYSVNSTYPARQSPCGAHPSPYEACWSPQGVHKLLLWTSKNQQVMSTSPCGSLKSPRGNSKKCIFVKSFFGLYR